MGRFSVKVNIGKKLKKDQVGILRKFKTCKRDGADSENSDKKKTDLNYLQPAKRVFTWYLWNVGAALWFSEPLDRESELLMLFKLRERTGER